MTSDDDKPNGKKNVAARIAGFAASAGFSSSAPPPTKRPKQFGDIVRRLRQTYNIACDRLDKEAGLPFGTVKRIEQNRLWPPWETLDKLCAHPSMRRLIDTCVREGVELGVRPPPKTEA